MKTHFLKVSKSSSNTVASTSAKSSNDSSGSDPGPDPVLSSLASDLGGLYKNRSYRNLPCGVKSAAYIGGTDTVGKLGVGKVEVLSPIGSPNLRTSLVSRPWRNFNVSGPRNLTTDRDLRSEATGPAVSR